MGIWLGPVLFLLGYLLEFEPFIFVSMVLIIVPITEYNDIKHPPDKVVTIAALRLYFCIVSCLISQFAAIDLKLIIQNRYQVLSGGGQYYISVISFVISTTLSIICSSWLNSRTKADAAANPLPED